MSDEDSVIQPVFDRSQVVDLAKRLTRLLADPALEVTQDERNEWERVRETAERLADDFDVPK